MNNISAESAPLGEKNTGSAAETGSVGGRDQDDISTSIDR